MRYFIAILIVSTSLFVLTNCSTKKDKSNKNYSLKNENDVLHDSLALVFKSKKDYHDSVKNLFYEELSGLNSSNGYGPNSKKIESELNLIKSELIILETARDSIFTYTSTNYKINQYEKTLCELDKLLKENVSSLEKSKKEIEDEMAGGGYGLEAKKKEFLIKEIEKEIAAKENMKDSIRQILNKLK